MNESRSVVELLQREERRRVWLAVGALTLLAAALRFLCLGTWSLWADEVATLRDAVTYGREMDYFLGYALIGLVTNHAGNSEWWARLVPAAAGVATVPVMYLIGRRLFNHRAGILAGLLLALSNYHLFFSQYARYYTLLVLFTLLGMWWAYVGIERGRRGWLAAAVAALALGGLTHWTAGLCVAALAAHLLWLRLGPERPRGLSWPNLLILLLPFALGGLYLSASILSLFREWAAPQGFSFLRAGLTLAKIADRLDLGVLACAAAGALLLLKMGDRRAKWLISYAAVPVLIVVLFVGFAEGGSRFAIVALPPVILLAAWLLDRLLTTVTGHRRKFAWALAGLVVLALCMKDVAYFTTEHGQRPRWKEAAAYAESLTGNTADPRTTVMTNAPDLWQYQSCPCCHIPARKIDLAMLRKNVEEQVPTVVLIEHVANVAPPAAEWQYIKEHATASRTFPAHVRFLDYSVTVYLLGSGQKKDAD